MQVKLEAFPCAPKANSNMANVNIHVKEQFKTFHIII